MLASEGLLTIGALLVAALAAGAAALLMDWPGKWIVVAVMTAALLFTMYFFRDPRRQPPAGADSLVLSPADGKVIVVDSVEYESLYLKGAAKQVSIFLSVTNVHVNRVPASGIVEYEEYFPGKYLVAWHPKSSTENERSAIGLVHESGARILFKQIAGAVARRIRYDLKVGDSVDAGQRFGIIKFGSRMDILMTPDVEIVVQEGDRVRAGESVIGRIREAR